VCVQGAGVGQAGDENGDVDVGADVAWVLQLRQLLRRPVAGIAAGANELEEAVRGLHGLKSHGGAALDGDELVYLVRGLRAAMHEVIEREGLQGIITVDQAVAIRAYTEEYPPLFAAMNAVMSSPNRRKGPHGVSEDLHRALAFIRLLLRALKALPARYTFTGRCYRGIRHVYPSPRDHDVARHYRGKPTVYFYEFKSTSTSKSVMVEDRFCGRHGARTIFEIDATCGYSIEAFSRYGAQEKEVLFPPGSEFKFVTCAQLCDPFGPNDLGPDIVVLQQVA
jgi:hypothetical protein